MRNILGLSAVAVLLGASMPAIASDNAPENDIVLGAGWFDFTRDTKDSANFSGEWRGSRLYYDLRPVIGAQVNTDGGTYGYVGLAYDWQFAQHWAVVPDLDVGAYAKGGSIDLGGVLEFHESIEVDYKFDNNYRIGAQIAHTSNADIYNRNPGTNNLMAIVSVPLY